jgi:hypothetical protein
MDQSLRRALLRRWIRGSIAIAMFLMVPTAFTRLEAILDPHQERREIAQRIERQQRAGGVRTVTDAGQTMRAVVYSPTSPSPDEEDARHQSLVWWARLLAAVTALGLLNTTWQLVRQSSRKPSSRPAT